MEEKDSFCSNHAQFHAAHKDDIAQLWVSYDDTGLIEAEFVAPLADFSTASTTQENPYFAAEADSACEAPQLDTTTNDGNKTIRFRQNCGELNRLRGVTITVFDHFPDIEELEARITTPATQKHFVISRKCDAPIYRLAPRGETSQ